MMQNEFADLHVAIAALNLRYTGQFCGLTDARGVLQTLVHANIRIGCFKCCNWCGAE